MKASLARWVLVSLAAVGSVAAANLLDHYKAQATAAPFTPEKGYTGDLTLIGRSAGGVPKVDSVFFLRRAQLKLADKRFKTGKSDPLRFDFKPSATPSFQLLPVSLPLSSEVNRSSPLFRARPAEAL
jgi:hypothetical protein